jgi:hypothetical protein
MAMKINAKVVGYGSDPGRTKALVNVIVEFSGATESMTLTVIVPNDGDEAASKNKALQEQRTSRSNLPPTDPRQSSNAARPRASVSVRIGRQLAHGAA